MVLSINSIAVVRQSFQQKFTVTLFHFLFRETKQWTATILYASNDFITLFSNSAIKSIPGMLFCTPSSIQIQIYWFQKSSTSQIYRRGYQGERSVVGPLVNNTTLMVTTHSKWTLIANNIERIIFLVEHVIVYHKTAWVGVLIRRGKQDLSNMTFVAIVTLCFPECREIRERGIDCVDILIEDFSVALSRR